MPTGPVAMAVKARRRAAARCRRPTALLVVLVSCVLALWAACAWAAHGGQLPGGASLHAVSLRADLDGDGAQEALAVSRGSLRIYDGADGERYLSPRSWKVADAFVGDVDSDGRAEVVLVVWKRGSYGDSRPFWVEVDAPAYSQHVFVMRYGAARLESVWMSSSLGGGARDVRLCDDMRLRVTDDAGRVTLWEWDYWGFSLVET